MQRIHEKIEKLLALSKSCNEHEAQSAMEKANFLMMKHNITKDDLVKEMGLDYIRFEVGKPYFREGPEKKYIHWLIDSYFFVKVITTTTGGYMAEGRWQERVARQRQLEFWGTKENIDVAIYINNFLSTVFKRLWKEYKNETGKDARYRQSYYRGLYNGLVEKLEAGKKKFEEEFGLVVINDPGLEKFTEDNGVKGGGGAHRPNYGLERETMEDGKKAAKDISLSGGVEYTGATTTKKIGYDNE